MSEPVEYDALTGTPKRIDHFTIVDTLGQGAMGSVFRAKDETLGSLVALKVIKPELAVDAEARARFLREARAAAALRDHDHIVTIYSVRELLLNDGRYLLYLAMPILKGETLEDRLQRAGSKIIPIAKQLLIGQQIAMGLAGAHEVNVVHRDIKPANIWLETRPDGSLRVKLLDFGLARSVSDSQLTATGGTLGTPLYMAPEQAGSATEVDARADLWSLGVILYRMATTKMPFKGEGSLDVLIKIRTSKHRPVLERNPRLDPRHADLIERLLQKKREQRPQSALEVAEILRQLHRIHADDEEYDEPIRGTPIAPFSLDDDRIETELPAPKPKTKKIPTKQSTHKLEVAEVVEPRRSRITGFFRFCLLVMILGAVAVGAYYYYAIYQSSNDELLTYLPSDSDQIIGANVQSIVKQPQLRTMLDQLIREDPFKQLDAGGVKLDDIDAVVFGGKMSAVSPVIVIRTKTAFDPLKLAQALKGREATTNGKKYYQLDGIEVMFMPSDRMMVISSTPVSEMSALMNRNGSQVPAKVRSLIDRVSTSDLWYVGTIDPPAPSTTMKEVFGNARMTSTSFAVRIASSVEFIGSLQLENAIVPDVVSKLNKQITEQKKEYTKLVGVLPPDSQPAFQQGLDSFRISQSDSFVVLSLSMKTDSFAKALKEMTDSERTLSMIRELMGSKPEPKKLEPKAPEPNPPGEFKKKKMIS